MVCCAYPKMFSRKVQKKKVFLRNTGPELLGVCHLLLASTVWNAEITLCCQNVGITNTYVLNNVPLSSHVVPSGEHITQLNLPLKMTNCHKTVVAQSTHRPTTGTVTVTTQVLVGTVNDLQHYLKFERLQRLDRNQIGLQDF